MTLLSDRDAVSADAVIAHVKSFVDAALKRAAVVARPEPAVPPTPPRKKPTAPKPSSKAPQSVRDKLRARVAGIQYNDNADVVARAAVRRLTAATASASTEFVFGTAEQRFPIIVIPNAQTVHPAVLETLVLALTHLNVRCCLLLGVSSTVEAFRSQLTFAATSRMLMQPMFMKVKRAACRYTHDLVSNFSTE